MRNSSYNRNERNGSIAGEKKFKEYAVYFEGITKRFPGIIANNSISFGVKPRTIHALIGENGAGKTTLINILSGNLKQNEGEIYINGMRVSFNNSREALNAGICVVHQQFTLIPSLSVWENIVMALPENMCFINTQKFCNKLKKEAENLGLEINPYSPVWKLSMGERQRVEIFKALRIGAEILVLDEPTSILTPQEVDSFLNELKQLSKIGKTIIFITHKLKELENFADYASVLRKGYLVSNLPWEKISQEQLIKDMIGENFIKRDKIIKPNFKICKDKPVLSLESVSVNHLDTNVGLNQISFNLFHGEIIGVAGIAGNGQQLLAEVIGGFIKPSKGKIRFEKKENRDNNLKIAYIPEDILSDGLAPQLSVSDNLFLRDFQNGNFQKGPFILWNKVHIEAKKRIEKFKIYPSDPNMNSNNLSGGNKQKLVISRELSQNPDVVIAVHPTKGLDVKAADEVRILLKQIAEQQASVLLISEDLDEIFNLSNRIIVMYKGEIAHIGKSEGLNLEQVGKFMTGKTASASDFTMETTKYD